MNRWCSGRRLLPATGLALWLAASASGQGLYYREIHRDARIYVFNDAKEADRFEKSGERGQSIVRIGAGPNGETVLADSELALQLFFFKHGISEVVPEPPPPPPPARPWRISGYMFGDYYYFAESHDESWKEQQGFWFRRIYLTYDHTLSPRFATRLRLEMNSSGELTDDSLTPYVKDAYLQWTYYGRQQLVFGIQPTPTFELIETLWGLRHIEKTPADLYRTDSSRDFGVSLTGPLNESQTFHYSVQLGNESGSDAEVDESKAVRASARFETDPGFSVEGFFGFFDRPEGGGSRLMGQGFAGYRYAKGRTGFQYYRQVRRAASGSNEPELNLDLFSAFGVFHVEPEKWSVFARVDRFNDPNPDGSGIDYLPLATNAAYTLVLGGIEYYLLPSVRLSPNMEWVTYGDPTSGARPADDLVFRATLYWTW